MESMDPAGDLDDVARLQKLTVAESLRTDRLAIVVLVAGLFVFVGSYRLDLAGQRAIAPVLWIGFVVAWARWQRHNNRASYLRRPATSKRDVLVWAALAVMAFGIAGVGDQVSWRLAGILFAALGAFVGVREAITARRRLRDAGQR